MKKLLSIAMCLCLILSTFTFVGITASADTEGYLHYSVSNGEATVTGYDYSIGGDITIPPTLGGYPVTTIGDYAFSECSSLTSVTIPDSVTSIGSCAFWGCSSLTNVNMGNSVTSIDHSAFHSCTSLTSVNIPDSVTSIDDRAFYSCDSLTSVTIPDSVTTIGFEAFYSCDALASIDVSKNNKKYCSVDGVLFDKEKTTLIQYPIGKTSTDYTIPDNVTTIGDCAFSECSSLTSVTIPDSVTTIGFEAFSACESLTSISIPDSVTSIGYGAFYYCESLTSISIPDSVTSIDDRAFYYCDSLKSVTIPDSVTTIGDSAFYSCDSLTSVTIPDSVTTIGFEAFYSCDALASIDVSKNNRKYCSVDGVLFDKEKTTLIQYPIGKTSTGYTIPDSITTIGYEAFSYCYALTSVTIPNSVTSIGYEAFYECTSLTSVNIPDSVTSIGKNAFFNTPYYENESYLENDCYYLGNILVGVCEEYYDHVQDEYIDVTIGAAKIKEGTKIIANSAFEDCDSLTSVNIPDSVKIIGDSAFEDCSSLTSVNIPDSVKIIGDSAFSVCNSLTSVNIPDSVKIIGKEAFAGCNSLTSVTIPDSVTTIGDGAFYDCYALTSISIPNSVTSIGASAFEYCNENFVIIAYEGTCAHSYAQTNNIKFEKIEHPHKYTSTVTKQPTCAKKGVKTYTCECGDSYTEDIATLAHKVVTDKAVKATCTKTGLTQGSHCATCKKVIKKQNTVKALGHKYKWVTTKKATYFAKGTSSYKCTTCGKVSKTKSIAKLVLKKPSFKLTGAKGKFTVKYTKVTGATGFEVKYKLGKGKFKTVKVTTKKSMSKVIKKLKKGKYTVQIRAYIKQGSKKACSNWTSTKTVKVK